MCTALSEIITVFLEWIKKEDTKDRGNLDVLPEGGKGGPGIGQVWLEWNPENLYKHSNQTDGRDVLR